ncbi:light-mediated development protein 1 [Actinidia rufa]|uniref:Light-mediated development protein 1 n=1 Tax=Actinidia rufa TaxID=165716 RepID=A0A7J0GEK6_9ERIC|nr:light-mediated development protein 1 [Actinidia rufa]
MEGRAQFLDRHHLLIKFGSVDGGMSRNADHHPAFFAVYNMETTEVIAFYQNSAEEIYFLFEQYCDHFHSTSKNSLSMNFISSHSNNIHALEQLRVAQGPGLQLGYLVKSLQEWVFEAVKSRFWDAARFSLYQEKMLASGRSEQFKLRRLTLICCKDVILSYSVFMAWGEIVQLPVAAVVNAERERLTREPMSHRGNLISAIDRHRQSTDHPIKFIARRQPCSLKFKIKPGPEAGSTDSRTKKISSFLFHPILPLALSVQQTLFLQSSVVNIHFRR